MTDKTISIPIYDCQLRVVICDTYEEFEQEVIDTGYDGELDGAGMIALRHPGTSLFVVIFNKDDISHGSVSHECLHITNRIMMRTGIKYSYQNDEAMCYLLGFVVDCVELIIKEHGSKD